MIINSDLTICGESNSFKCRGLKCLDDVAIDFDGIDLVILNDDLDRAIEIAHQLQSEGYTVHIGGPGDLYSNEKKQVERLMESLSAAALFDEKERYNSAITRKSERFVSPKHKYNTPRWQR